MFYLIKFTLPKNAPKHFAFIILTSFLRDALRQSVRPRKFEMIVFCTTLVKMVKSVVFYNQISKNTQVSCIAIV